MDRAVAIDKMMEIERLYATLPGIDCGSCGAPNCFAFASDVVKGVASPDDCIYLMREQYKKMTQHPEEGGDGA